MGMGVNGSPRLAQTNDHNENAMRGRKDLDETHLKHSYKLKIDLTGKVLYYISQFTTDPISSSGRAEVC